MSEITVRVIHEEPHAPWWANVALGLFAAYCVWSWRWAWWLP